MTDSKVLITLATDCLRLSMHFFHPIQQCAQQVYHTALPLSPTSSPLRNSYLRSVTDNQLSRVTAFSGAPDAWGLLLRAIDISPRQPTPIATFAQEIVAACGNIVDIYDAVTFVPRQFLRAPETITKMQGSPDGSILFFAHSHSVTMWDVQTGGLTHTFTTRSEITDIAVSTTGDHIACGSSDGSVVFWDIHTKEEGEGFGNGQPVVTIHWLSPVELAVATQEAVYIHGIVFGETLTSFSIPGYVWGMVYSPLGGGELLVGTSQQGEGSQVLSSLEIIKHIEGLSWRHLRKEAVLERQPQVYLGMLLFPVLIDEEIACITEPTGVQSFNIKSCDSKSHPPLLDAATSVAVSLNRNLVAQTEDSIKIFSLDVLSSSGARDNVRTSHVYPLGEKYILCLQPDKHLAILDMRTLQELHPDDNASLLQSSLKNQSPSARGLVAEFGISAVMQTWQSRAPLPEWTAAANEEALFGGSSPDCTWIVTFYDSPWQVLRVKDANDGTILANLHLEDDDLRTGKVYDVAFDSETRFHVKIDGPGWHVRVSHEIITSPWGPYSHTTTKEEPVPLSKPRESPMYTLDANCEWVVDTESRKICWISPGNVRRGDGGHFWAGLELVMVGDDGVVRKLSFREPDR
jgi:WD40 repeat protein